MSLVAERLSWLEEFKSGWEARPCVMKYMHTENGAEAMRQFRVNWKSEMWRHVRQVEKTCAHALWIAGEWPE